MLQSMRNNTIYNGLLAVLLLQVLFFIGLYGVQANPSDTTLILYTSSVVIILLTTLVLPSRRAVKDAGHQFLHLFREQMGVSHLLPLLLVIILAVILRVNLITLPITVDESRTVIDFSSPQSSSLIEAVSEHDSNNNHPLNSLATFFVVLLSDSTEEYFVRLPALMAGIVLVGYVYFIGRSTLKSHTIGIVAAVLIAVNPDLIRYSALSRGYIFSTLAFTVLIWAAWETSERSRPLMWTMIYLCGVLGLYANVAIVYGMLPIYGWLYISLLIQKRFADVKTLTHISLGMAATFIVLYMPMFLNGGLYIFDNQWTQSVSLNEFIADHRAHFLAVTHSVRFLWDSSYDNYILAGVALGALWEIVRFRRLPLAFVLPVTLAMMLIVQHPEHVWTRVFIFVAPLAALYVAMAVSALLRHKVALIYAISVVFVVLMLRNNVIYERQSFVEVRGANIEHAIDYLIQEEDLNAEDAVVGFSGENWVINYYIWQLDYSPAISLINRDPTLGNRIFIIVPYKRDANEVIDHHLARIRDDIVEVTELAAFEFSTVYEIVLGT